MKFSKKNFVSVLRKTAARVQNGIKRKDASDQDPLLQSDDSIRLSQKNACSSYTTHNASLPENKFALIVLNSDYSSCKGYSDLKGVTADGEKMLEMLLPHGYTVVIVENPRDIKKVVQDFCKRYKNAETIHFHYSGHGIDNVTLEIKKRKKKTEEVEVLSPFGDCLVGSCGKLCAVHDLKIELMEIKPTTATISLDCCRDSSRKKKKQLILRSKRKMSTSNLPKIAVFYGTSEQDIASDSKTFTRELNKVYKMSGNSIPILDIERKVNKGWKDQGMPQMCNVNLVQVGDNWLNYKWPSSKII